MNLRSLKRFIKPLIKTPFHPQWYTTFDKHLKQLLRNTPSDSIVLDIGCFDMWPRQHLPAEATYIGLDYFETATQWYHSKPHVFGDALSLPFASGAFDTVLLLDVLEHLEKDTTCLNEIQRVLKPGGVLILQVPFLYPIHDAPRDFRRLTEYGLQLLAENCGLKIENIHYVGTPLQTVTLLGNLALSHTMMEWVNRRHPLLLLVPVLPVTIVLGNLLSWLLDRFTLGTGFMPFRYTCTLIKPENG